MTYRSQGGPNAPPHDTGCKEHKLKHTQQRLKYKVHLSYSQRKSKEKFTVKIKKSASAEKVGQAWERIPWGVCSTMVLWWGRLIHTSTHAAGRWYESPTAAVAWLHTREWIVLPQHTHHARICFHRATPGIPSKHLGHQHKTEKEREKGKKEAHSNATCSVWHTTTQTLHTRSKCRMKCVCTLFAYCT